MRTKSNCPFFKKKLLAHSFLVTTTIGRFFLLLLDEYWLFPFFLATTIGHELFPFWFDEYWLFPFLLTITIGRLFPFLHTLQLLFLYQLQFFLFNHSVILCGVASWIPKKRQSLNNIYTGIRKHG
jgi:hypothetical protein